MSSGRVVMYYDIVSPYTWLGFELLSRYRVHWSLQEVVWRPVLLGALLKGAGTRLPSGGLSPAKAAYTMQTDLPLLARHYGVPLKLDGDLSVLRELMFRRGSLATMRFLTALRRRHSPDALEAVSRQLFLRLFSRHRDVTGAEGIRAAAELAGLDAGDVTLALDESASDSVKAALRAATDEALAAGAFGLPTFVVHTADGGQEVVFGSDRFHIIGDLLGREYAGPPKHLSKIPAL